MRTSREDVKRVTEGHDTMRSRTFRPKRPLDIHPRLLSSVSRVGDVLLTLLTKEKLTNPFANPNTDAKSILLASFLTLR